MTTPTTAGKKQALDGSRLNAFAMDPEKLTLITDPKHPLYDIRATQEPDEVLVRSILKRGVKNPVIVRKNGKRDDGSDVVEIVDGRRRYIAAREANRRLTDEGADALELIRVPCILEKGNENEAIEVMVLTNEQRREDDPLNRAAKAVRLLERGRTEEEVADVFGVTTAAVRAMVALHSASDDVRAAVKSGAINQSMAVKLSDLPAPKQKEQLEEIATAKAEGKKVTTADVAAKVKAEKTGGPARKAPGKKEIKRAIDGLQDDDIVRLALLWAIGEGDMPACLREEPNLKLVEGVEF